MSVTSLETLPLNRLRPQTIMAFCELLDLEKPIENDYRALAQHLGITYIEMERLKREVKFQTVYPSISMRLFCQWASQSIEDANAQLLIDFVKSIGREDIYREIEDALDDDFTLAKSQGHGIILDDISDLWKTIKMPDTDERVFTSDLFNPMKVHDVFISYNPNSSNDEQWMEKIVRYLTVDGLSIQGRKLQFRVAVGPRDLLPGDNHASSLVRAIKYRCKRVILLISDSFKKSSECVFQMQIAKSLDLAAVQRKIIPVRLDNTELPDLLFNLNAVNLNVPQKQIEREMKRLAMSLM